MTHRILTQAEHVIGKLGGINPAARLLGHKNASTVQGWWDRGFIPGPRQRGILDKARQAGLPLTESDFIVHLTSDEASAPGVDPAADADHESCVSSPPPIASAAADSPSGSRPEAPKAA